MARPKKIEEESQENIVEATEVSEVTEDTKVEEVVPAEEPTVVEEPAAAEPVKEEPAVEEPTVEEPKATEKPAKKSKKSEKIAEVKEPIADTSKKAAIASADAKSFVVSSIPAYMAPNVNSAFGLISGLFIADGEVTNGAGLSFTAGYTLVPGAGGKVKIYVKTSDLK